MKYVKVYALALAFIFSIPYARAGRFNPDDAMTSRIATRFRATMDQSGISGVGNDVLKCYDDNLDNAEGTKECIVYDLAALIFDRQMMQLFDARGLNGTPAPMFTNRAYDARSRAYGLAAFKGDEQDKRKVGPAANRVIEKAFPK